LLDTSRELIIPVNEEAEESGTLRKASSVLPVARNTTLVRIEPSRGDTLESAVPEVMEEGAVLIVDVASNTNKAEAKLLSGVPSVTLGVNELRPDVGLEVQVAVELLKGIHSIESKRIRGKIETRETEGNGSDVDITLTNVHIISVIEENLNPTRIANHAFLSSSSIGRDVFVDLVVVAEMAVNGANSSIIELLEGVEASKISTSLVPGEALEVEDSGVLTSEEVKGLNAVILGERLVAVEVDALTLSSVGRADVILEGVLDIHGLREALVPVVAEGVADVEGVVLISHASSTRLLDQDVGINGDVNGEGSNATNSAKNKARLTRRVVVSEDVSSDESLANHHGDALDEPLVSSTEELNLHDLRSRERNLSTFNAAISEALERNVVVKLVVTELSAFNGEVLPPGIILVEEKLFNAVTLNSEGNSREGFSD
jgi:hypothetical protein